MITARKKRTFCRPARNGPSEFWWSNTEGGFAGRSDKVGQSASPEAPLRAKGRHEGRAIERPGRSCTVRREPRDPVPAPLHQHILGPSLGRNWPASTPPMILRQSRNPPAVSLRGQILLELIKIRLKGGRRKPTFEVGRCQERAP